jgi:hypothetical protein
MSLFEYFDDIYIKYMEKKITNKRKIHKMMDLFNYSVWIIGIELGS